ncbi:UDP-3-O-acyl-N-acetylglucosamine deacetylase [Candidatus Palauibacter sp.]|uniref:UDP-3-O-acyl-N-acetylglucosamine deacetylase n=1 Tax=Candidatus Palauibacter sp. TaxID=3101350 RepID=UPI003AF27A0E
MTGRQRTIARPIEVRGHGLHTGEASVVTLHPAPENTGLRFRRTDLPGAPELPATVDAVDSVYRETALRRGEAVVRTVEHVLSAAHGLGLDNLRIDVSGPEPPALDGSAAPWCQRLLEAGEVVQKAEAPRLRVDQPFRLRVGEARYDVLPAGSCRVSATIDFDHPLIGRQFASVRLTREAFVREIAGARTFGLSAWRAQLHERGLALGATPENTLVLSAEGLEADQELRFPDEFVRHKILDIVGDLALVGARLQCHVISERPGHRGNLELARRLRSRLGAEREWVMDVTDILKVLPHRYPMLLVDRVLEIEPGKRIVGLKNVSANEPFFAGHFPGRPVMPGVLIVEALAQCGGLLLMGGLEDPEEKVIYFLAVDDVKFRRPVVPGDQLRLELELLQGRGRRGRLKGVARVDGKVVAEATILGQIMDR